MIMKMLIWRSSEVKKKCCSSLNTPDTPGTRVYGLAEELAEYLPENIRRNFEE